MPKSEDTTVRRVALLTHGLASGGGVPAVARWLFDELQARPDYQVDVFDLATSRRDRFSRRLITPSTWFRTGLLYLDPETGVWNCGANAVEAEFMRYRPRRELTRALDRYDLIQVVSGSPAWAQVTLNANVPVVVQAATTVDWERESTAKKCRFPRLNWLGLMTRLTTAAERIALQRADAVLVENREMCWHVHRMGQRNVQVAPPGIDTDKYRPNPSGRSRCGPLLSVCRFGDPRKSLDRMIRAYGRMVRCDPGVPNLVLAGRGRLDPAVTLLISELGLATRVSVRSDVPQSDLYEMYREASVFLQTSWEEGLGISLLQAMASGLPVVTTDTAGSRETVVDEVTGWIVAQSDNTIIEFAEKALTALTTAGDAPGLAGRKRCVDLFSSSSTLRSFTETYSRLLSHGPPAIVEHVPAR